MLAKRIIPVMLVKGRTLVKGMSFDSWRSVGHAAQAASIHARRQVDELLILDIAATAEGRGPDLGLIRELARDCFIPITVGGGVRSLGDIDQLLRSGADKVAICAAAYDAEGALVKQAAQRFGSQAVVVCVEHRAREAVLHRRAIVFALPPSLLAEEMARLGAGEILLQSVQRDGTQEGYDLDLIREVSEAVPVPVIASGGCSGPEDMAAAIRAGASAVAAGALFQFTDHTPRSCAQYLHAQGVTVRLQ